MASLENLSTALPRAPVAPIAIPMFDIWIDEDAHLVRTTARGFWALGDAEDYVAELAEQIEGCRRRFGRARVLADRRGCPSQSEAVVDRLGEATALLFAERDRLALVVDSSLEKSRMRRRFSHAGSQAFLSHVAAELWLTAWP